MRKLFGLLAVGALVLGSSTASAAPVSVDATLGVNIQNLGTVFINGSGTVDKTGSTVTVGSGLVGLTAPTVIPVTGATAISFLSAMVISNGSGTFSVSGVTNQAAGELCGGPPASGVACNDGGGLGGVMGLQGTIFVHVIPHVVVIPVNLNGALIGQGGSTSMPFIIDAAAWSTGVGRVGTPNGTANLAGTESTFSSGGTVTLVTPTFVSALGNLLPIFTFFTLDQVGPHVPEPGTLLLLGSGVAGLVLVGSRRRK